MCQNSETLEFLRRRCGTTVMCAPCLGAPTKLSTYFQISALPLKVERVMGIEPTFLAWEATFLPLEDTRVGRNYKA